MSDAPDHERPVVPPDAAWDPTDRAAREDIAEALDVTLVVEAAAGTGKTTELINRILRVLESGRAAIEEIVAVTFTEKAAGELKLRLRESLEARRAAAPGDDERARLDRALATLEETQVNTIHGFCATLLRERPVEALVDPLFTVLTEAESRRLYDRAFKGWLQSTLADPPEGVRRALRRSAGVFQAGRDDDDGPIGRLRSAGWALVGARDMAERLESAGVDPASLAAIVLSHEHTDHSRGATAFSKKWGVRLMGSRGTYAAAGLGDSAIAGYDVLEPGVPHAIGALTVTGIAIPHDAAGPLAFVTTAGGCTLGHATDFGHVSAGFVAGFRECDAVLIESNYDPGMLREGPYPWSLKERILGRYGHLSNGDVASFLARDLGASCRTVILAHLSKTNNHPDVARMSAEAALGHALVRGATGGQEIKSIGIFKCLLRQFGMWRRQHAAEVGDRLTLPCVGFFCDLQLQHRAAPALRARLLCVPEPFLGAFALLHKHDVISPGNL